MQVIAVDLGDPRRAANATVGLESLKSLAERRKKRHDTALNVWENERKELYDAMEEKVGRSD